MAATVGFRLVEDFERFFIGTRRRSLEYRQGLLGLLEVSFGLIGSFPPLSLGSFRAYARTRRCPGPVFKQLESC